MITIEMHTIGDTILIVYVYDRRKLRIIQIHIMYIFARIYSFGFTPLGSESARLSAKLFGALSLHCIPGGGNTLPHKLNYPYYNKDILCKCWALKHIVIILHIDTY